MGPGGVYTGVRGGSFHALRDPLSGDVQHGLAPVLGVEGRQVVEGLDQVGGDRVLAALARFVPGRVGLDHYDRSGIKAGPGIRAATDDFGGRIASTVRGIVEQVTPIVDALEGAGNQTELH